MIYENTINIGLNQIINAIELFLILIASYFLIRFVWQMLKRFSTNYRKEITNKILNEEIKNYVSSKMDKPRNL